jgi:hypothetical protein
MNENLRLKRKQICKLDDNTMLPDVFGKELANWIYYEDGHIYYCFDCVQKRVDEINSNKEFAEDIDYVNGDDCGYYQGYADEGFDVECCKCGKPLYSTGADS